MHYAVKRHGRVPLQTELHVSLMSELNGYEWSALLSSRLNFEKSEEPLWTSSRYGWVMSKMFILVGNQSLVIQPMASYFIDWLTIWLCK
jgi:hypothetical protein